MVFYRRGGILASRMWGGPATCIIQGMGRINRNNLPFWLFGGGTATAALIVAAAFGFANPPQCPSYTAVYDNCVVGANIGLGLYVFLAIAIWIVSVLLALAFGVRNILSSQRASKSARMMQSMLLIGVVGVTAYFVVAYFLERLSDFVAS